MALKGAYEQCTACAASRTYGKIPKIPCFQSDILDVTFFRNGKQFSKPPEIDLILSRAPSFQSLFYTRRKHVYELSEIAGQVVPTKSLQLTHGLGVALPVSVSEFVPEPGDKLCHGWKDSLGIHTLELRPYCLANIEETRTNMRQYLRSAMNAFLDLQSQTDDLTWHIIQKAIEFAASNTVSHNIHRTKVFIPKKL